MMLNSLTENDVKMYGVPVLDLFLAYEARQLSKEIGSVERVSLLVQFRRFAFNNASTNSQKTSAIR